MLNSDSDKNQAGNRVTLVGAFVNLSLIGIKFAAGFFGNSYALITDAVHSVSDLFTDAIVLFGLRMGRKEPDEDHHFGHARLETLSSLLVGLALLAAAIYLGIEAGFHIYTRTEHHPTYLALIAAVISISLKEAIYHYTVRIGRRIKSPAILANAWHHRSDSLSSVAVLIGIVGVQINPEWHILDDFAAIAVSLLILKVGIKILLESLREFTDAAPRPAVLKRINSCARDVKGVIDVHDLKVRTSGGLLQMELHVIVDGNLSVVKGHGIAKEVEGCLFDEFEELGNVIVHVDPSIYSKKS